MATEASQDAGTSPGTTPGRPAGRDQRYEFARSSRDLLRLVGGLTRRGVATTAAEVDHRLWRMGQAPEVKAVPRHRCRCTFY